MRSFVVLLALSFAAGCGPASPATPAPASPSSLSIPPAASIPVVPGRMELGTGGDTLPLTISADGSVTKGGTVIVKIVANQLVGKDARVLLTVDASGRVDTPEQRAVAQLDASDVLTVPEGMTLRVRDDGVVEGQAPGKSPEPTGVRFVPFAPSCRREALLLTYGMFAAHAKVTPLPR